MANEKIKKTTQLKKLLNSSTTEMIMEAHNGLSGRIVEEAGFKGIWASGLAISAALGVRDCNEASWTQVLEVLEFMSDNTTVPILVDADTGYGNFNNVRRLIKKLEQRSIAGICIEDKLFPKTNSFIGGERQPLADIEEFCGKIKAAKDCQQDPDFTVVARIEALIAGWGMEECLRRAKAYVNAGADALLLHSKAQTVEQIKNFMKLWDRSCPVIAVPTTYHQTKFSSFEELGVSLVIFANHMVRSSITQMKLNAQRIFEEKSLVSVEPNIVPVSEVFRLQNQDEPREAEKKYLPQKEFASGIILAASQGVEFENLTADRPKTMIELDGKPILERIQEVFNHCKIKDVTAVLGFRHDIVSIENLKKVIHNDWAKTGNAFSLYQTVDQLKGPVIISYGDIVFEDKVLQNLMDTPEDIVISADYSWSNSSTERNFICHVISKEPPSEMFGSVTFSQLQRIGYDIPPGQSNGEWIGLIKLSTQGSVVFKKYLMQLFKNENSLYVQYTLVDFIRHLMDHDEKIFVKFFPGHWLDVDNKNDLKRYQDWKTKVS